MSHNEEQPMELLASSFSKLYLHPDTLEETKETLVSIFAKVHQIFVSRKSLLQEDAKTDADEELSDSLWGSNAIRGILTAFTRSKLSWNDIPEGISKCLFYETEQSKPLSPLRLQPNKALNYALLESPDAMAFIERVRRQGAVFMIPSLYKLSNAASSRYLPGSYEP